MKKKPESKLRKRKNCGALKRNNSG